MNKIIPFNKEIKFDDVIGEITSIVVDDTLAFKDSYTITGDLIVKGSHKYGDIEEDFNYPIPTSITVDDKYDTSKAKISVDDFYYEIINDNTLKVKIDLILDDLFFKEERIEPITETIEVEKEISEPKEKNIESKEETPDPKEDITDLFKEMDEEKEYSIYRVYVVCEGDTVSKILEKYNITSEELSHYNDIENIKPGVKLIIPSTDE